MLTAASLPHQTIATGDGPIDVETGFTDINASFDAVVLNSDGSLTVATNADDGTWSDVSAVDLGIGSGNGLTVGFFDADTTVDVAIQSNDAITFVSGNGTGGFAITDSWTSPVAGSLGSTGRTGITTGLLNDDFFPDVVAVAPGTSELLAFRGNGDGTFDAPFVTSSGGNGPVAIGIGNLIGNLLPDLVVGHTDGTLSFLEGHGNGTFTLRGDLTVTGPAPITDLAVEDLNGDGELDIVVTTPTSVRVLTNDVDVLTTSPIVNGSFNQGLTGWMQEIVGHSDGGPAGKINGLNGFAQLTENESFLVSLNQTFEVPAGPQQITVDLLTLGLENSDAGLPDAFEISLLDANGNSLVTTHASHATSFFNVNPGGAISTANGVTFDGTTVTLDISAVPAGTSATLFFDLVGNPPGDSSVVVFDNVRITPDTIFTETFSATPLSGTFTNATSVATGDVDGDGLLDIVVADAGTDTVVVFNGTAGGAFLRDEIDVSGFGSTPLTLTLAPLTAGDSIDDISVTLFNSDRLLTPLQSDVTPPDVSLVDPLDGLTTSNAITRIEIQFTEAMFDGGTAADNSVTNPASYSLIHAGPNGVLDAGSGDDVWLEFGSVSYDTTTFTATLTIAANSAPLADGLYEFSIAGDGATTALQDLVGLPLRAGNDATFSFTIDREGPQINPLEAISGDEGGAVSLSATFADPGNLGPHTARVFWGDGSSSAATIDFANGSGAISAQHTYADDGSYSVRVDVVNAGGVTAMADSTATIGNVAPTPAGPGNLTLVEGDSLTLADLTFTDPGFSSTVAGTTETFTASIDWGDGTIEAGSVSASPGTVGVLTSGSVHGTHAFQDDGHFTVTVTVTDDDGGVATHSFEVEVLNAAPAVTASNVTGSEGTSVTFTGDFIDSSVLDNHVAVIDWGDGATSIGTIVFADGVGTVSADHTYADNGSYSISLTVSDGNEGSGTADATATISNVAPSVTAGADQSVIANIGETLLLATFEDPGFDSASAGTAETFSATIDWGDGSPTEAASIMLTPGSSGTPTAGMVSKEHFWTTPGFYTITVTITDDDGGSDASSITVEVINPVPEFITITPPVGGEGSSVTLLATFDDPGDQGPHTALVDWGDGTSSNAVVTFAAGSGHIVTHHIYADDGEYLITLELTDEVHNQSSIQTLAAINGVAPSVDPAENQTVLHNQPLSLTVGTFTDPGFDLASAGTTETFTAQIDWGDGSAPESGSVSITPGSPGVQTTGLVAGSHVWSTPGSYTVTVTVRDDDEEAGSATFDVNVINEAPLVSGVSVESGQEGSSVTASASFTDTSDPGPHTALIDWGDGTETSGFITFSGGTGTVTGSHTYGDNGSYVVTIRVIDEFGEYGTATGSTSIDNIEPTLSLIANALFVAGSTSTVGVGTFSDPGFTVVSAGTAETFTVTIDWGDGTVTSGTASAVSGSDGVPTTGTISGTHSYSSVGNFTVTVTLTDDDGGFVEDSLTVTTRARFFVVDQSAHESYLYTPDFNDLGSFDLTSGNSAPRGATTNPAGDTLWVANANSMVFVYDVQGNPLGSWKAKDARQPEGVATDGTSIWIVGDAKDKVYYFAGAASRVSGQINSTSQFNLHSQNRKPSGIATDGTRLWITDEHSSKERVFIYDTAGNYLGHWNLDSANGDPSGITLDPSTGDLYVSDRHDGKVYRYAGATSRTSGSQSADGVFHLNSANHNPEGIADPIGTINIGDVVVDSIAVPGEVDDWQFTGSAGQAIFIDGQASTGFLDASLLTPAGTVYAGSGGFSANDIDMFATLPVSGTWTIRLTSNNNTPTYQFQLLEVPPPDVQTLTFNTSGAVADGAIEVPGALDRWEFSGTAGDLAFLDWQNLSDLARYRLIRPSGSEFANLASSSLNGIETSEPYVLDETGVWQIQVEGPGTFTPDYQFTLYQSQTTTTTIDLDASYAGAISPPGSFHAYEFPVNGSVTVFIDWLSLNGSALFDPLIIHLIAPDGSTVLSDSSTDFDGPNWLDNGPLDLTQTGTYTLLVDANRDDTFTYSFQINNVGPVVRTTNVGDVNAATLADVGREDFWNFTASAGQNLFIDWQSLDTGTINWQLYSPGETLVASASDINVGQLDDGPIPLTETGQYRLEVGSTTTSTYQFQIWDVPAPDLFSLNFGQIAAGVIEAPGQHDEWTLTASAGTEIFLDWQNINGRFIRTEMIAPSGSVVLSDIGLNDNDMDNGPIVLTETGDYTVKVSGFGSDVGSYEFRVFDVTPVAPIAIPFDTIISGTIDHPGQLPAYTFTGAGGQNIVLDWVSNPSNVFGSYFEFHLTDPSNSVVTANITADQPLTLSSTGTYTLTVQPSNGAGVDRTGSFAFRVIDGSVVPPLPPASDLVVTEVSAPRRVIGDPASIAVSWTITNNGASATEVSDWIDRVYLSVDGEFQRNRDSIAAEVSHSGVLDPGASYTESAVIALPAGFEGDVSIFVETDSLNQVFEEPAGSPTGEENNVAFAATTSVFKEQLEAGPPAIDLDIEDGASFPTGSTISLSGQASVIPGTTNVIFALDVSGSTSSVDGLDANFDGIVDSADDLNSDGSIGDILDTEIGAVQRVVQNLRDNGINASVAVVLFGTFSEAMDLGPQFYHQTFVDLNSDEDGDGVFDIDQAVTSIQPGGADRFRSMSLATGTSFSEAILQVNSVAGRTLDAELTQVLFLTDGSSSQPPLTDVEELASSGVDFHGFQITGSSVSSSLQFIADTVDATAGSSGATTIVEDPRDLGRALLGALEIAGVMVNNAGVQSLDELGRFFTPVTITSGTNVFTVEAIDSDGRSSFRTVTLEGVDPGVTSFDTLQDVSTQASVAFTKTTFNRLTRQLHADATLTADLIALDSPVLAQFDPSGDSAIEFVSATGRVTLNSPDGINPDTDAPYIRFDSEIPSGSLNVGESGTQMPLSISNSNRQRFGFEMTILGSGNSAPFFSSVPRTQAINGVDYSSVVEVTDPDGHDVTVEILTGPAGLAIDPPLPGERVGVRGTLVWSPAATQRGIHEVVLRATDGRGGSALQTFSINVQNALPNRPPVFQTAPPTQIDSGTSFNYVPKIFDLDGDTVTFSLPTAPAGAVFNTSTGEITLTAPPDGSYDFELIADDANGGTASQEFTLTVGASSTNDGSPVIFSTPVTVAAIDELYLYLPFAQDPDGDPLTFSLAAAPAGMTINSGSGRIDWTPAAGQLGLNGVLLRVEDGQGHAATQFFNILVLAEAPDRAPLFLSQPDLFATQDETFSYNPLAIDPEGFAVTYALVSGPAGATFDPVLSTLNYLPSTPDLGVQTFEISATDPEGETSFQRFFIDVRGTNTAPTFTSTPIESTVAGASYRYNADATDTEDNVTFSLIAGPSGSTIDPVTGVVTWTPDLADVVTSPHSVIVRATDDRGLFTDQSYDLAVNSDTEAPVISIRLSDDNVDPGTPVTITVAAMDNVDVSSLTVTINGAPVTLVGGQITFTPPAPGLNNITATATDSAGNTSTATTTLRALDPTDNTAPVINITSPSSNDVVTYLTDIIGSITDDNLTEYEVAVSRVFSDQWTTTFSQTFPDADGVLDNELLAVFDPTLLLNGVYDIRVTATDLSLNSSSEIVTVNVEANAKIGVNHQSMVDLMMPVAGGPAIQIHRSHSQLTSDVGGSFGNGWQFCAVEPNLVESVARSEFEDLLGQFVALPFNSGDRVYITTPDCQRVGFTFSPVKHTGIWSLISSDFYEPRWIPDPGVDWELYGEYDFQTLTGPTTREFDLDGLPLPLLKTTDGFIVGQITASYNPLGYQLINKQGVRYHYDQYEGLTDVTDRNGNTLTFDEAGITSSSGQHVQFLRDGQGRITNIIDQAGREVSYTYDVSGNLIDVTYPEGLGSSYRYTAENYLAAVNPDGAPEQKMISVGFEYDVAGRLAVVADALGATNTFDYQLDANTHVTYDALGKPTIQKYDDRGNLTEVTSPNNNISTFQYDADDNLTVITDERGFDTAMTYDDRRNLTSVTDARGNVTQFVYNEQNDILEMTLADGTFVRWDVDDSGNIERIRNSGGTDTTFDYDDAGRLTRSTDVDGGIITFEYDVLPYPVRVTERDGSVVQMTYNHHGHLESFTDPRGYTTTFSIDHSHRPVAFTDALGGETAFVFNGVELESTTNAVGATTSYVYDDNRRPIQITDEEGGVIVIGYDPNGRQTSVTDQNGNVTTYAYRPDGRLESTTDAQGGVTAYEYDASGNQTASTDPNGNRWEWEYDELGYTSAVIDPHGFRTAYEYDSMGNLIRETDALGRVTQFEYGPLQRPTRIVSALGNEILLQYDWQGNLTSETDLNGNQRTYAYDEVSRLILATDPLGNSVSYTYDVSGNRTSITDERGFTTTAEFDELDRVARVTDPTGAETAYTYDAAGRTIGIVDPAGGQITLDYDLLGRVIRREDQLGGAMSWTYDGVSNPLSGTDEIGRVTTAAYDSLNRRTSITDPLGAVTHFNHDANGNIVSVTDPVGNETTFSYDALDRVVRGTDPLGNFSTSEYDAVGNLTELTDRNGRVREFVYDDMNRLTTESWLIGATIVNTLSFTYDAIGNLLTAEDNFSEYTHTFDRLHRLTSVDNAGTPNLPHVVLTNVFDASSNRISVSDNASVTVDSDYDSRNQLTQRLWSGGGIDPVRQDYDYNSRGLLTEITRYASLDTSSLVSNTTFDFDAKYRLTDLTHFDASASVLIDYQYTRDLADQLTQEIHHGQTYDYTRDDFGQLLTATVDGQLAEEYEYDDNGNRVTPFTVTGADNRLQEDANFTYQYDAEGNLIRRTDKFTSAYTLYEYDHRNRLVKAQVYDSANNLLATVENTYDVFDRLITRSHDADGAGPQTASVRHTVYDGAHAWADYDDAGNVTDRFLFNDGTDFIAARFRPGEGTAFYLTDHLGTVREIIDAGGNVINAITYDSFGRILSRSDPLVGDRFTFTGREWDPELGFYYYRARFYDPTTGRFISQDPIGFASGDSNLYRYVGNGPLDYVDPSGNLALTECAIVRIATVSVDVLCPALQLYLRGEFEGKTTSEIIKLTANQALFGGDLNPPKDATVEEMLAHTIERTTHFLNVASTILPSGAGMAVQLTLKAISLATVARSLANVIANDQLFNVMSLAEGYVLSAYKYAKDPAATFQQAMTALEKQWEENKTEPLFWSQVVCGTANLALMVLSAKARCFVAGTPIVVGIIPPDEPVPDEAEQELLGITTLDVVTGAAIAGAIIIARRRKEEEEQEEVDLLDGIDSTFEDFDPDCLNEPHWEESPEAFSGDPEVVSAIRAADSALTVKVRSNTTRDDAPCVALNQSVSYKPDSPEIIEPPDMPHKEKQQPKKKTAKRSWAATLGLFGCLLVALVVGSPRWTPLLDGREAAATVSALPSMASPSGAQPRLITKPIEEIRCGDRIPSELPDGLLPNDEPEPDSVTWRLVELELTKPNGDLVEVKLLRSLSWLQQAGAINDGTFPINVEELDIEGEAAVLQVLPCPVIQQGEGQVVTGTFRHTCDEFVHLHIDAEPAPITCTTGHPIWSEDRREFIPASNLQSNDTVRLTSGKLAQVSLIKYESGSRNVFNFEVNGTHVYHVGTTGALVHNAIGLRCDKDDYLYHGTKSDQNVTKRGLRLDEIKKREGHDKSGFSLTPYPDIAEDFANNPLRPGAPTVLRIRKSVLRQRGISLESDIGLTEAGELKILPRDFPKIQPGDFEIAQ